MSRAKSVATRAARAAALGCSRCRPLILIALNEYIAELEAEHREIEARGARRCAGVISANEATA